MIIVHIKLMQFYNYPVKGIRRICMSVPYSEMPREMKMGIKAEKRPFDKEKNYYTI